MVCRVCLCVYDGSAFVEMMDVVVVRRFRLDPMKFIRLTVFCFVSIILIVYIYIYISVVFSLSFRYFLMFGLFRNAS